MWILGLKGLKTVKFTEIKGAKGITVQYQLVNTHRHYSLDPLLERAKQCHHWSYTNCAQHLIQQAKISWGIYFQKCKCFLLWESMVCRGWVVDQWWSCLLQQYYEQCAAWNLQWSLQTRHKTWSSLIGQEWESKSNWLSSTSWLAGTCIHRSKIAIMIWGHYDEPWVSTEDLCY